MKKDLFGCLLFIAVCALFLLLGWVMSQQKYEYIDMQGNKGIGNNCNGSQSGLVCYQDEKVILVREFKLIGSE